MEIDPESFQNSQEPTKALLGRSLGIRTDEAAPKMPQELKADLLAHFAASSTAKAVAPQAATGWQSLRQWFAKPAHAFMAAAAVFLAVLTPLMMGERQESFRGQGSTEVVTIPVVLIGGPAQIASQLTQVGDLEAHALHPIASAALEAETSNPKVLVDFIHQQIQAVDAEGQVVHQAPLPAEITEMSAAIADAVSRL